MPIKLISLLTLSFVLLSNSAAYAESSVISLISSAPYEEGNNIRKKIISECPKIGSKLSSFTQSFAKKSGIDIELVDSISTNSSGRVLKVEISDAVSQGNGFIGHRKFVSVNGSLWENGKKISSFEGQRTSGGGFAGGYKSSCSVLGRCVKALGKDIAAWLQNPVDDASLGD